MPPPLANPSVTPFISKTYQILSNSSLHSIIHWSADGRSFIVEQPAQFARDVLPQYFKHNNVSSFVRQLNTYGFKKVGRPQSPTMELSESMEFSHPYFRRKCPEDLPKIVRRKTSNHGDGILEGNITEYKLKKEPSVLSQFAINNHVEMNHTAAIPTHQGVGSGVVDSLMRERKGMISAIQSLNQQNEAALALLRTTMNELASVKQRLACLEDKVAYTQNAAISAKLPAMSNVLFPFLTDEELDLAEATSATHALEDPQNPSSSMKRSRTQTLPEHNISPFIFSSTDSSSSVEADDEGDGHATNKKVRVTHIFSSDEESDMCSSTPPTSPYEITDFQMDPYYRTAVTM